MAVVVLCVIIALIAGGLAYQWGHGNGYVEGFEAAEPFNERRPVEERRTP
jgi:hypothetical protein